MALEYPNHSLMRLYFYFSLPPCPHTDYRLTSSSQRWWTSGFQNLIIIFQYIPQLLNSLQKKGRGHQHFFLWRCGPCTSAFTPSLSSVARAALPTVGYFSSTPGCLAHTVRVRCVSEMCSCGEIMPIAVVLLTPPPLSLGTCI